MKMLRCQRWAYQVFAVQLILDYVDWYVCVWGGGSIQFRPVDTSPSINAYIEKLKGQF